MPHPIWQAIRAERARQERAWPRNYGPFVYVAVLTEEVGEVARAIHDAFFGAQDLTHAREELVQVAAVAVQMIERIDAGKMPW